MTDRVLVIGGGIAGLAAAIRLAPLPVTLITGVKLATGTATAWAQGGIAAALGDDDGPASHAADTLKAAAGIGDPSVAERVTVEAPAAIDWIATLGAPFDRDEAGKIALALEAAHSHRRIVHAQGDATGRAVLETLIRVARTLSSIALREDTRAADLVVDRDGAVTGIVAFREGRREFIPARAVVLATGGIGGLYAHTTNPLGAVGSGLAMAARAGAVLRDVEFVQFHPTAIDLGRDPMPLATEALRGEGAVLVDGKGNRFMADVPGRELAPRDIVARAIWRELERGEKVFLDGRDAIGARFPQRFPSVTAACRDGGLDPVVAPIPVRPAAHYHMGGVRVDARGRASLARLWACGEVAATGLHGANRLASNSLLEALVFARWVADDIRTSETRRRARSAVLPPAMLVSARDGTRVASIRKRMEAGLGVIRDAEGMEAEIVQFDALARQRHSAERDLALVGLLIAAAAFKRRESRGSHFRADYPQPRPKAGRFGEITLDAAQTLAFDLGASRAAARAS